MELTTSWKEEGIKIGEARGIEKGLKQASLDITLRLLNRRLGSVSPRLQKRIARLSIQQLQSLSEALLDFQDADDLIGWLDKTASKSC